MDTATGTDIEKPMVMSTKAKLDPLLRDSSRFNYFRLVTDFGILAILFVAPMFMGGRHPLGTLIFVVLVFLTCASHLVSKIIRPASFRYPEAFLVPMAGLILIGLQLIPISKPILSILSPNMARLLPIWQTPKNHWSTISLTPILTCEAFVVYLSYSLFFFLLCDHIRTTEDVRKILRWVAWSTLLFALIAIVQYMVPNGRFLWIYAHPTRDTFGAATASFANPNHFAHRMLLGMGALIWLAFSNQPHSRGRKHVQVTKSAIALASLCVTLLATFLSFSRGGCILTIVLVSATVVVLYRNELIHPKRLPQIIAIVLVFFTALTLHGLSSVRSELKLSSIESSFSVRTKLWSVLGNAIPDFARFGSGAASHREIYPTYLEESVPVEFTHAENGYLQILVEMGSFGLFLLLMGILVVLRWIWTSHQQQPREPLVHWALGLGIVTSFIHSFFDFVWHIPALMSVTLVLIAGAFAQTDGKFQRNLKLRFPKLVCAIFLFGLMGVGGWSFRVMNRPAMAQRNWENYLTLSIAANREHRPVSKLGRLRDTKNASLDSLQTIQEMKAQLERVLKIHPYHARAHDRLASLSLQEFDFRQRKSKNPMGIGQIRDAAYASHFATHRDLEDWLGRAVGENLTLLKSALQHSRNAIRFNPLQGTSYLYLSETAFLESPRIELVDDFIRQAESVRPANGSVLFAVGQRFINEGDFDSAFRKWRNAFHQGPEYRDKIFEIIAPLVQPKDFATQFRLTMDELVLLFQFHKDRKDLKAATATSELLVAVVRQQIDQTISVTPQDFVDQGTILLQVQRFDEAAHYFQRAFELLPFDFTVRWRLANSLFQAERFEDAHVHLQWCYEQKPYEKGIEWTYKQSLAKLQRHQNRIKTATRVERFPSDH